MSYEYNLNNFPSFFMNFTTTGVDQVYLQSIKLAAWFYDLHQLSQLVQCSKEYLEVLALDLAMSIITKSYDMS